MSVASKGDAVAEAETLGAAGIATLILGSGGVIGFFRLLNEMRAQERSEREERRGEFAEIRKEMRLDRQEARAGRQEERTEYATFFATYDKSIASLKVQYDTESDQSHKQEIGKRLAELATDYRRELEEYRNTIDIVESVDKGRVPVTPTPLTDERRRELTEGLETSKGVRPALLTAIDFRALGNAAYQLENYEDAVVAYTRSVQREGDDAVTLSNRGNAFWHLEHYEEALADYNRSLELSPGDPVTLSNRGNAFWHLQHYEESLADYNRSLELRPDHPATLNSRGVTLQHLQRHNEALVGYNLSLELRPDDPGTLYNRACVYSQLDRANESLKDLKEAISRDEKYRKMAREDEDFANLRSDPTLGPEFDRLVAEPEK